MNAPTHQADLIDDDKYSLHEICVRCRVQPGLIEELISHRVVDVDASGSALFGQGEFLRLQKATRLHNDLELNAAGTALALELLDTIDALRRELSALRSLSSDRISDIDL